MAVNPVNPPPEAMQFLADFLNEDWSDRPAGPRVYLGAFGKHPGWNDHFDLGLETESLVAAKRLLYDQGIGSEIEGQTWEKLQETDRVQEFDHSFLWLRPRECLIGCLWSSRDGKGRGLYPFVLCAHLVDLPLSWSWRVVVPLLQHASATIKAASTAGRVISTVADTLNDLRAQLPVPAERDGAGFVGSAGVNDLGQAIRADSLMLYPIYQDIVDRLGAFGPGICNFKSGSQGPRAQSLRLPAMPGGVTDTLNSWAGFLMSEIDPGVPILGIMPSGADWADFILGQPARGDMFNIRAGRRHVPFVTDRSRAPSARLEPLIARKISELEHNDLPQTSLFNGQLSLRNLSDAVARLDAARASGKGLFWRLFGSSKPRAYTVFAAD